MVLPNNNMNSIFSCFLSLSGRALVRNMLLRFPLALILVAAFGIQAQTQGPRGSAAPNSRKLFETIRNGSVADLEQQLARGADPNDSLDGYSALMAATLDGTEQSMQILLDHGAKVNYADKNGITAIWLAVPDWGKTKLLLERGADPQMLSKEGYSVLVKLAAIPGTLDLFHLLIAHGADLKKSAPDNFLLYSAASSGDTAVLGLLIRGGLRVNDTVSFGDYPIDETLTFRTSSTLKMLVENGANVNVQPSVGLKSTWGFSPLMWAAVSGDKPSLLFLLDHGANPNLRSSSGYTALILLAQAEIDDSEMTQALLDHGADPKAKTPDGNDALYFASQKGNTPSVELLKQYQTK
jgi:uncharacterized protein